MPISPAVLFDCAAVVAGATVAAGCVGAGCGVVAAAVLFSTAALVAIPFSLASSSISSIASAIFSQNHNQLYL